MVKQIKSFKLLGHTITVCENHEGEFESQRKFIRAKQTSVQVPWKHHQKNHKEITPLLKLPLKVTEVIKSAGGTDLTFLMNKKLKDTDIDKNQNRIYVSRKKTLIGYLTEYEKQNVERQGKEGGLEVAVIDQRGEVYGMKLKFWASSNKCTDKGMGKAG